MKMLKNYLVEMVYLGKLHEPFGTYYGTSIEKVVESLKEEVDKDGYVEECQEGLKFTSSRNESHWMIYEHKN